MYETIIGSPLFLWSVLSYLILLYHSFGIEEIQEKIRGVELLFVSVVLGTIFLFVFDFLKLFIERIIYWANSLIVATNVLPVSFDPFHRELHEPGTTLLEYYAFGLLVVLFVYYISIWTIVIIIKITQFCLDPENRIFHKYRRFYYLKKYNVRETLLSVLPTAIFCVSVSLLVGSLILGYWINLSLESNIMFVLKLLVAIIFTILFLFFELLLMTIIYYDFPKIKPIKELLFNKAKEAMIIKPKSNHDLIKQSKVLLLTHRYMKQILLLIIIGALLMTIIDYYNKIVPFWYLVLGLITFLLVIVLPNRGISKKEKNN